MSELPKIVAATDVGKKVKVKIWRNQRELKKNIILGRLETSSDFKSQGKVTQKPKEKIIEGLKITVRLLDKKDVQERKLPKGTTGVVITKIEKDSPLNYLEINNINYHRVDIAVNNPKNNNDNLYKEYSDVPF